MRSKFSGLLEQAYTGPLFKFQEFCELVNIMLVV